MKPIRIVIKDKSGVIADALEFTPDFTKEKKFTLATQHLFNYVLREVQEGNQVSFSIPVERRF